ncbi:hypothetical protein D3C86_2035090 [compost metagenome]
MLNFVRYSLRSSPSASGGSRRGLSIAAIALATIASGSVLVEVANNSSFVSPPKFLMMLFFAVEKWAGR